MNFQIATALNSKLLKSEDVGEQGIGIRAECEVNNTFKI